MFQLCHEHELLKRILVQPVMLHPLADLLNILVQQANIPTDGKPRL